MRSDCFCSDLEKGTFGMYSLYPARLRIKNLHYKKKNRILLVGKNTYLVITE